MRTIALTDDRWRLLVQLVDDRAETQRRRGDIITAQAESPVAAQFYDNAREWAALAQEIAEQAPDLFEQPKAEDDGPTATHTIELDFRARR